MYGEMLKNFRGETSQSDFAKKYGVSQSTYARYEAEESEPSFEFLSAIAKDYHVTLDYIITGRNVYHIDTYGELLAFLDALANKMPLFFSSRPTTMDAEKYMAMDIIKTKSPSELNFTLFADILIFNESLGGLFETWQKMRTLVRNQEIEQELYDMWLQKRIRDNASNVISYDMAGPSQQS